MAQEKDSKKITAGNVIAVVGLALLAVFTFIGHSYLSGGETGWDIVTAVVVVAITAFLLWFLMKTKTATKDLDKWKKTEYATLAVYVVFAIVNLFFCGLMHFFVINGNKAELKEIGKSDISKISLMFDDYREYEAEAVSQTGTGLQNATGEGQRCSIELAQFMTNNNISHNHESAKAFEDIQKRALLGDSFEDYYRDINSQTDEMEDAVDSWSMLRISAKASLIDETADAVGKELSRLSKKAQLPKIEENADTHIYDIVSYQRRTYSVTGSMQFSKKLKECGFSMIGLLVALLIHAMILFNYYVVPRGEKPEEKKNILTGFADDNSISL